MSVRSLKYALPLAAFSFVSSAGWAEDLPADPATETPLPVVVEKITVSASVAEERRDPATFTSLDGAEIQRLDRGQDLAMLLGETPNAYAYSDAGNGVGYAYLSLRGFDQRRVAININGVPLNGPENRQVYFIDLADLAANAQSIQVQRGTGTALYGSPAVGGVVQIETGALPNTRQGELRLTAGSFGTYRGTLAYTTPLGPNWSLQARASHVQSDGYRDPSWTKHTLGQLALQRVGTDSVLRVLAFGGPEKTQLAYYAVPIEYLRGEKSGDADRDRRLNPMVAGETDHFVQPQFQVIHDWRRGNWLLKNTAYAILGDGYFRQFSGDYSYDPLGPAPPSAAFPEYELSEVWRKRQVTNRDLGYISSFRREHKRGRLTLGLELLDHTGHHQGRIEQGACAAPACVPAFNLTAPLTLYDYENGKRTAALFVRESWRATEQLTVEAELSATAHRYRMRDDRVRGYSFDSDYAFVTPRLGLNWNVTPQVTLYGSLSTAKSEPTFSNVWDPQDAWARPQALFGGFDANSLRLSDAQARPERLRAAEAGLRFTNERAQLRANVYLMDFRDELVYAGGLDDDGQPITDNAARSLHRGLELEAALRLPGELRVSGHLAISADELRDYTLQYGPTPADSVDYSGNRIALFPEHQARLRLARTFGPLELRLGLRRIGRIYLDNSQDERKQPSGREAAGYVPKLIEPFTLGDAQAELDLARMLKGRGRKLKLEVSVENLFDQRYVASGYVYDVPYFYPGATRSVYAGVSYGF